MYIFWEKKQANKAISLLERISCIFNIQKTGNGFQLFGTMKGFIRQITSFIFLTTQRYTVCKCFGHANQVCKTRWSTQFIGLPKVNDICKIQWNLRLRPSLLSDQFSKIPKASNSNRHIWNLLLVFSVTPFKIDQNKK